MFDNFRIGSRPLVALGGVALACLLLPSTAACGQATQEEKLPSADALLQKIVKATGGEQALRRHTHQKLTGTFELPAQGLSAEMVIHGAAPNLRNVHIEVPGFGQFLNGYNGSVAWRDDPQSGAQILEGAQHNQTAQQADYYNTLNYHKNFQGRDVMARTEFGDKDCYEIKLTDKDGVEQQLFIDAETNLIAGTVRMIETPQGEVEVTTTIEEYKEFDGEMIGVVTRADFGGFQEQVITVTEVSFEEFDHEAFALPDSIKALLSDEAPASKPDN
jgi:hypothetical protein